MTSLVLKLKTCAFCLWILFMGIICLAKERKLVISLSRATNDLFNGETRPALRGTISKFWICYLISNLSFKVLKGRHITFNAEQTTLLAQVFKTCHHTTHRSRHLGLSIIVIIRKYFPLTKSCNFLISCQNELIRFKYITL